MRSFKDIIKKINEKMITMLIETEENFNDF